MPSWLKCLNLAHLERLNVAHLHLLGVCQCCSDVDVIITNVGNVRQLDFRLMWHNYCMCACVYVCNITHLRMWHNSSECDRIWVHEVIECNASQLFECDSAQVCECDTIVVCKCDTILVCGIWHNLSMRCGSCWIWHNSRVWMWHNQFVCVNVAFIL